VQAAGCNPEPAAPEEAVERSCAVCAFVFLVRPVVGLGAGFVDGNQLDLTRGRRRVVERAHCHDQGAGCVAVGAAAGESAMVAGSQRTDWGSGSAGSQRLRSASHFDAGCCGAGPVVDGCAAAHSSAA